MSKVAFAIMLLAVLAAVADAQSGGLMCFEEGWKIDPGKYDALDAARPTYGTWFNRFNHEEYMWVHSGTMIDFYGITDKSQFDQVGSPTIAYSIPAGSTCKTAESFILGESVVSIHGDDVFCTCNWRPEAPCPSRLKMSVPGESDVLFNLATNTNVPVDTVVPDVAAIAAIPVADGSDGSPTSWACTPLVNTAEMAGKFCLSDRGGCYFQTKYDNCKDAGALGAIVVNRDDSVLSMGVKTIEPNYPFIMIGNGDGQIIKDKIAAGKDVTLSAGRGVGPPQPLAEYTQPDAMGMTNIYTGERVIDTAPFILAEDQIYDHETMLLYVFEIDGNRPAQNIIMNMTQVVDGSYPVVGTFGSSEDRTGWSIIKNDAGTFLAESVAWQDQGFLYDINGENAVAPKKIATIPFQKWCPDLQWRYGGFNVHPTGDYIYAAQGLRSDICGDYDGDGVAGDYVQEIYDISDPYNPKFVKGFLMNEVEMGAVTMNGGKWEWGRNGEAGISMTSAGFVLYDFSDPENPVAKSVIYDPAENVQDFTKGVLDARYGDDGFWYVYEKDGVDGAHGEFHQLKVVPCDMPAICKNY